MGAHNSVVAADQGFRGPSWTQESVRDSVHEDSASALWVPKTVMLLCLSSRDLGEVPLVAFGEVAVVVEAPFEC